MAEGIQIENLPSTTAVKQGDTMTIVQDKQNKQLSLDVFANESDLATLSPLENRCDEVKAKIEVDEYSAEITTSQSMSEIGSDDNGANLHENVLDGAYESCVLKGKTKYIDNDTQEILDTFQDGRNLSLIDVKSPVLTTTGKNLFDKDKEILKYYYFDNLGNHMAAPATDNFIDESYYYVNNSNKITLSNRAENGSAPLKICTYDINKNFIRRLQGNKNYVQVILANDEKYIRIGGGISNIESLQLEFGDETSYEPFKSNILTVNEDLELRGIGDIKDELNLLTEEVTERIGEIVLDGSEDGWRLSGGNTNELRYGAMCPNSSVELFSKTLNDKFINGDMSKTDILNYIYAPGSSNGLVVTVDKTKLETVDITGFKKWLSQNPITVQYQLATESIKTVDVQGFPFSYENGHVILSSGSTEPSLTPTVTYKVPVSRVGQIASNTKSNLRQTIKLDQLEILAYQSLINAEYENLLVQNSAESATSFTNLSTNDPKDELYYMLKHLIEENQPVQNMLDKINLFYLYGLLSDEHYFDLLLGGEEDVY